jgi:DNA polymerase-3 subunit gamma/tau
MAYVVLARKWRPMTFEKVIGQEHVTRTIMNALKIQRIAHAYIFAGPRGVGKTTTARLLAKAVNCENQPVLNPCNSCKTCQSITKGIHLDVIEIDGASNRGIDEIRNLRENIKFAPATATSKIYIIDEVHMLTKEAFNALLKTLEEPPSHAIFILATTEIHKVPPTILSRCQRFDFKRISVKHIHNQLEEIVLKESLEIESDVLHLISKKADGSMRDAESILDQMISFSEGQLTSKQVRDSLGIIEQDLFFEFSKLLIEKDNKKILDYAHKIINTGYDLLDFLQGLQVQLKIQNYWRFLKITANYTKQKPNLLKKLI